MMNLVLNTLVIGIRKKTLLDPEYLRGLLCICYTLAKKIFNKSFQRDKKSLQSARPHN